MSNRNLACPICLSKCHHGKIQTLPECKHEVCRDCLKRWFKTQLVVASESLCVPVFECPSLESGKACKQSNAEIQTLALVQYLDDNDRKVFSSLKTRQTILSHQTNWNEPWFCPEPGCFGAVLLRRPLVSLSFRPTITVTCPECVKVFQGQHRPEPMVRPWTDYVSPAFRFVFPLFGDLCSEWEDSSGVRKSEQYILQHTKRCPNIGCAVPIEKNHGCPRMKCTMCRTEFCWECLKIYKPPHNCQGPSPLLGLEESLIRFLGFRFHLSAFSLPPVFGVYRLSQHLHRLFLGVAWNEPLTHPSVELLGRRMPLCIASYAYGVACARWPMPLGEIIHHVFYIAALVAPIPYPGVNLMLLFIVAIIGSLANRGFRSPVFEHLTEEWREIVNTWGNLVTASGSVGYVILGIFWYLGYSWQEYGAFMNTWYYRGFSCIFDLMISIAFLRVILGEDITGVEGLVVAHVSAYGLLLSYYGFTFNSARTLGHFGYQALTQYPRHTVDVVCGVSFLSWLFRKYQRSRNTSGSDQDVTRNNLHGSPLPSLSERLCQYTRRVFTLRNIFCGVNLGWLILAYRREVPYTSGIIPLLSCVCHTIRRS